MTYTLQDFGPADLLTSSKEGVRRVKIALPSEIIGGSQAITVQSFTEMNSKDGTQFEASVYSPDVAGGESVDIVMVTGDVPVILKRLSVGFDSDLLSIQLFRSPTYTDGTAIPVYNYSDRDPQASVVTLLGDVSVTDAGTPVSPLDYSIGSEGVGGRRISGLSGEPGVERILAENTTYMWRITNENSVAAKIAGHATWHEGPLSTDAEISQ